MWSQDFYCSLPLEHCTLSKFNTIPILCLAKSVYYTTQMSSITLETHHLPNFSYHNRRHLAGSPLRTLSFSSESSASSFGLRPSTWIEPLPLRNTNPPSTSGSYWGLQSPAALPDFGISQGQDPATRPSSSSSSSPSFESTPVVFGTPLGCESDCLRPEYDNQPRSGLSKQIQEECPIENSLYVGLDLHRVHLLIRSFMTKVTVL